MKRRFAIVAVTVTALVSGCGVESASTAATAAAVKQKEIEQRKNTVQQVQENVGKAVEQMQQRSEQAADGAGK